MSLTVSELRDQLSSLSLDTRGNKQTLKSRLAKHNKSSTSPSRSATPPPIDNGRRPQGQEYDSYLVFDVEATCERLDGVPRLAFAYPNEIIEWPVILLQWRQTPSNSTSHSDPTTSRDTEESTTEGAEWRLEKVAEFHSYVKPTWNPILSQFCTELTGITQDEIDSAPTFPRLLRTFKKDFIIPHELFTPTNKTIWVTDGPWDLRDFIAKSCYLSKTRRPDFLCGPIIDLKLTASHFFSTLKRRSPSPPSSPSPLPPPYNPNSSTLKPPPNLSIPCVLSALTLPPFEGRLHSGLSDARNLSRIVVDLASRAVGLEGNRTVPDGGKEGKERRWGWMDRDGKVKWEQHKAYEMRRLGRENEKSR